MGLRMEDDVHNRIYMPLAAVVVMTLTACSGSDERAENAAATGAASAAAADAGNAATGGSANAVSGTMPQMRPGNYEVRVAITRFEVPGLPPEVAAAMQQGVASASSQARNQCVTAEQANRSMEDVYKQLGQGNCTVERMSMTGGQISGAMRCDAGGGRVQAITIEGTMTDTGSTTNLSMVANDPNLSSGQIETDMSVTMVRTGDCAG
jgi:hypothetical protein